MKDTYICIKHLSQLSESHRSMCHLDTKQDTLPLPLLANKSLCTHTVCVANFVFALRCGRVTEAILEYFYF